MLDDLYLPAMAQSAKGWADWKALLKILTFGNKSLSESFLRYLMRDSDLRQNGCTINSRTLYEFRHFAMYASCRKHELVYANPPNLDKILKTAAADTDECVRRQLKEC
ncbi:hypothetical protein CDV31_013668 [Fusarium ambrosium]|uniref:Uncharacterized protein n=1 Tax=Fusarium ambrosium TaxID=131363 RepID=A0A428T1Y6_9HYPO|nr:hypothetical protein CDV31_013668 [Fusarium ambrosium]